MHASFYRKLHRAVVASEGSAGQGAQDALAQVKRDVGVCLNILAVYARKTPLAASMSSLAQKVALDERFSASELRQARNREDSRRSPSAGSPQGGRERDALGLEAQQLRNLLAVYGQVGSQFGRQTR